MGKQGSSKNTSAPTTRLTDGANVSGADRNAPTIKRDIGEGAAESLTTAFIDERKPTHVMRKVELQKQRRSSLEPLGFDARYNVEDTLGVGGMGRIDLCHDLQIGRHVAMKVVRSDAVDDADSRQRFLDEARIQGQLEHPSIVPVYDLGVSSDGKIYFTMKRVRGLTLEEVVEVLASGAPPIGELSLTRLLRAFSQVCLAVEFAHRHGVIHRDLKPSNIMLGDFGEVYVLDWGLAKLRQRENVADRATAVRDVVPGETDPRITFGTPGYASPEQIRGQADAVGPQTDVYALGAVLFEILCLKELHTRSSVQSIIASTVEGVEARPSVRAPEREIDPELEEVLVNATALHVTDRCQTARALGTAIDDYLDGQRNAEQRRELAAAHARRAILHTSDSSLTSYDGHTRAMQELGRALTLDPENEDAKRTLSTLLSRQPTTTPVDVQNSLTGQMNRRVHWMARAALVCYLSLLLYVPLFHFSGVREWTLAGGFICFNLLSAGLSLWQLRHKSSDPRVVFLVFLFGSLAMACTFRFFGPLLMAPAGIAFNTTPFMLILEGRLRSLCIGTATALIIAIFAVDHFGIFPSMYTFNGDEMIISAGTLSFSRIPSSILLLAIAAGHILTSAVTIARFTGDLRQAEERQATYLWRIKLLAPDPGAEIVPPRAL